MNETLAAQRRVLEQLVDGRMKAPIGEPPPALEAPADDARMRLQLGKRLQQLVFDNAALRRTCDDLERHAQKAF